MNDFYQEELDYWLKMAQQETKKAIFALHRVLEITGSADKTINQLLNQENLVGYSTIGNVTLLIVVSDDLKNLLEQPGVQAVKEEEEAQQS